MKLICKTFYYLFTLVQNSASNAKLEEARKKREERKLARQKQLEAKREKRTNTALATKI